MEEKDSHLFTPEQLAEINQLGSEIYETRLRTLVEAEFDGQYVAIHVDTGDYETAKNRTYAARNLLKRHPIDGRIYVRKIGNEPDYVLAARIMAGEMMAGQMK